MRLVFAIRLPPEIAGERGKAEDDQSEQERPVTPPYPRHLIAAQLFIDLTEKGFISLRGQRQACISRTLTANGLAGSLAAVAAERKRFRSAGEISARQLSS